jgi:hypothetical protein
LSARLHKTDGDSFSFRFSFSLLWLFKVFGDFANFISSLFFLLFLVHELGIFKFGEIPCFFYVEAEAKVANVLTDCTLNTD